MQSDGGIRPGAVSPQSKNCARWVLKAFSTYLIACLTFTDVLDQACLWVRKPRHRETASEEPNWDSGHKALLPVAL